MKEDARKGGTLGWKLVKAASRGEDYALTSEEVVLLVKAGGPLEMIRAYHEKVAERLGF